MPLRNLKLQEIPHTFPRNVASSSSRSSNTTDWSPIHHRFNVYPVHTAEVEASQPRSKTMKTKGGTLPFPSGTRAPSLSQMTCENATADTKCTGRTRDRSLSSLWLRAHIHTHTSVLLSSREFVSHERSHDFRALVQVSLSPPLLAWLGLDREKQKRNGRVVRPVLAPFFFSTTCVERALNKSWPPNRKLSLGFADSRKKFNCY